MQVALWPFLANYYWSGGSPAAASASAACRFAFFLRFFSAASAGVMPAASSTSPLAAARMASCTAGAHGRLSKFAGSHPVSLVAKLLSPACYEPAQEQRSAQHLCSILSALTRIPLLKTPMLTLIDRRMQGRYITHLAFLVKCP